MGTEDWIIKGTELTTNTKKAKIKNLEQKLGSQKYNIKNTKQNHKNYKIYIYMKFALKIGSYFLQSNSRFQTEN